MLVQAIKATWHRNRHLIVNSHFDINLIVKLIGKTDVFKIQSSHSSPESSKFVDLFTKGSAITNTGVSLKNYKMHTRRNCGQSKDGTNMFEGDKNTNAKKKNDRTTVDSDYDNNNI